MMDCFFRRMLWKPRSLRIRLSMTGSSGTIRRPLIRVHVVVGPEPGVEPVRAYVSLSTDRIAAGGYRAIVDIRSSEELYQVMLRDAIDELERMRRKYESIRELRPVFRAVDRVASKHKPEAARATA